MNVSAYWFIGGYMISFLLLVIVVVVIILINKSELNTRFIINMLLGMVLIITLVGSTNYIMTIGPFEDLVVAQNNDWISFWGSFLGGVISGIATLIVIYLTIKTSRELNKDIIEANTKDVKNTLAHSDGHFIRSQNEQRKFFVDDTTRKVHPHFVVNKTFDRVADKFQRFDVTNSSDDGYIVYSDVETVRITNVGIGTALEVDLELVPDKDGYYKAIHFFDEYQNLAGLSNLFVAPSQSIDLEINYDSIGVKEQGIFAFFIVYRDIYKNKWKQKVHIQMNKDDEWIIFHVDPPICSYVKEFLVDSTKLP